MEGRKEALEPEARGMSELVRRGVHVAERVVGPPQYFHTKGKEGGGGQEEREVEEEAAAWGRRQEARGSGAMESVDVSEGEEGRRKRRKVQGRKAHGNGEDQG